MRRLLKSRKAHWAAAISILAVASLLLGGVAAGVVNSSETSSLRDQASAVKAGQVLREQRSDGKGALLEEQIVDPAAKRLRVEKRLNDVVSTVIIYDAEGHSTMNGVTLEVFSADANYDEVSASRDPYVGLAVKKVGSASVDGREVGVFEGDDARLPSKLGLRVLVDEASGLRVREELREDGVLLSVVTREIISSVGLNRVLDRAGLASEQDTAASLRAQQLHQLDYPVFGLPDGFQNLHLSRIVPGPEWNSVRLEYKTTSPVASGAPVVITTVNTQADRSYPAAFLRPIDSAERLPDESGEVVLFGKDGVGVKIQVAKEEIDLSARSVADALVRQNR